MKYRKGIQVIEGPAHICPKQTEYALGVRSGTPAHGQEPSRSESRERAMHRVPTPRRETSPFAPHLSAEPSRAEPDSLGPFFLTSRFPWVLLHPLLRERAMHAPIGRPARPRPVLKSGKSGGGAPSNRIKPN
ncbi:hypothetical protein NL676_037800 [Syzygium grande]|nr:hypothetical protein NL676_037800 [Syzygium grande]